MQMLSMNMIKSCFFLFSFLLYFKPHYQLKNAQIKAGKSYITGTVRSLPQWGRKKGTVEAYVVLNPVFVTPQLCDLCPAIDLMCFNFLIYKDCDEVEEVITTSQEYCENEIKVFENCQPIIGIIINSVYPVCFLSFHILS